MKSSKSFLVGLCLIACIQLSGWLFANNEDSKTQKCGRFTISRANAHDTEGVVILLDTETGETWGNNGHLESYSWHRLRWER